MLLISLRFLMASCRCLSPCFDFRLSVASCRINIQTCCEDCSAKVCASADTLSEFFSVPVPCLASASQKLLLCQCLSCPRPQYWLSRPTLRYTLLLPPSYFCLEKSPIDQEMVVNQASSLISVVSHFLVKDWALFSVKNGDVIARTYEGRPPQACWPDGQNGLCGKSSNLVISSMLCLCKRLKSLRRI